MAAMALGWRRLYDALGVTTKGSGDIFEEVQLASGKTLTVYLGPTPPIGIIAIEAGQYGPPGRESLILHSNSEYTSSCFLEVSVTNARDIPQSQFDLLEAGDQAAREELLKEASAETVLFEKLLDVVSGILALRFHRQLVLKPLVEHAFFVGGSEPVSTFVGPAVEMLEGLDLNQSAARLRIGMNMKGHGSGGGPRRRALA